MKSPKGYTPTDTRKEMALTVGIGEPVMGRIAQLSEDAPPLLKEALENKKVFVNRGWKILKAVQRLPTGGTGILCRRDAVGCAGN